MTRSRAVLLYTLGYSIFSLLIGGFEVALVLRFRDSILDVLWMQMSAFATLFLGFLLAARWLKKGQARRLFRFGFLLQAVACVYLALMLPSIRDPLFLLPFFLLRGCADGAFSGGRTVVFLEIVEDRHRDQWVLQLQVWAVVLGMLVPPIAGFLVGSGGGSGPIPEGYRWVLLAAGVWALGCLLLSPRLEIRPQAVQFRAWRQLLFQQRQLPWITLLSVGCLSGVSTALASAVLNFRVLQNELSLGAFAAWISLLSGVFFALVHFLSKRRPLPRIPWIFVGSVGELVSRLVYSLSATFSGLFAKSLLDSFVVPFRGLLGENVVRKRLDSAAESQGLSLAQVVYFQESVILSMRLATGVLLGFLFSFVHGDGVMISRVILFLAIPLGLVEFFLLRMMDRQHRATGSS